MMNKIILTSAFAISSIGANASELDFANRGIPYSYSNAFNNNQPILEDEYSKLAHKATKSGDDSTDNDSSNESSDDKSEKEPTTKQEPTQKLTTRAGTPVPPPWPWPTTSFPTIRWDVTGIGNINNQLANNTANTEKSQLINIQATPAAEKKEQLCQLKRFRPSEEEYENNKDNDDSETKRTDNKLNTTKNNSNITAQPVGVDKSDNSAFSPTDKNETKSFVVEGSANKLDDDFIESESSSDSSDDESETDPAGQMKSPRLPTVSMYAHGKSGFDRIDRLGNVADKNARQIELLKKQINKLKRQRKLKRKREEVYMDQSQQETSQTPDVAFFTRSPATFAITAVTGKEIQIEVRC